MNDDVGDSERVSLAVLSRVAALRERHTFLDFTNAVVLDIHLVVGELRLQMQRKARGDAALTQILLEQVTVLRDQPRQRPVQSFLHITSLHLQLSSRPSSSPRSCSAHSQTRR